MNDRYVKQQLHLLYLAISNVIDKNPHVTHITLPEIQEWIADILEDGWA